MQVIRAPCTVLAVSFLLLAGTETTSVVKRSDDSNPLVSVVERLTAEVAQLQARVGKWLLISAPSSA